MTISLRFTSAALWRYHRAGSKALDAIERAFDWGYEAHHGARRAYGAPDPMHPFL